MDPLTLGVDIGRKFKIRVNFSIFEGEGGQKSQVGVDFPLFNANFGQKSELRVDFSDKFTPTWLFWP